MQPLVVARDVPDDPPAVAQRGAREQLARRPSALRELGGVVERRLRRRACRPPAHCASPSASSSSHRAGGSSTRVERELVQARRLLVGEQRDGAVAGAAGVGDRLGGRAGRAPRREVVGQLGEVRLGVGCVDRLECLAGAPVQRSRRAAVSSS